MLDCDNNCVDMTNNTHNRTDECGVCGGPGIRWDLGHCNCTGVAFDCAGVCGGSCVVDECGVCCGKGI